MKISAIGVACCLLSVAGSAYSGDPAPGTIHTILSNLEAGVVQVQMDGGANMTGITPTGVACTQPWTANSMADQNFKNYVLPLLLTAKATKEQVAIYIKGCEIGYPKIYAIDYAPR